MTAPSCLASVYGAHHFPAVSRWPVSKPTLSIITCCYQPFFALSKMIMCTLKSAVQVWDVSCERQVEIRGPDADKLLQMTTPRDLKRMSDDQCYYIPMVDENGRMLSYPVLIKLDTDRYWVSLADTDMLYYFKGLTTVSGLMLTSLSLMSHLRGSRDPRRMN